MENQTDSTSLIPAPHRWEKIVSIRPAGRAQATCIKVSDPSHLYLTTGGIITHNTAGAETPRSYIGRDGRIRILDTVPESERNAAILEAKLPAGQQLDPPDFDRIYAPASPAVRREAERIAKDIMGLRSQSAENFNRWFADSKIVTPDGSPRQVFHGSNGPIEAFETRNIKRRNQTTEWSVLGAFFTPQRKEAEGYANWATQERGGTPTTQGYYLSIKNPKRLTSEQIDKIDTEEQALDLRQRLEAAGHDGIIIMARGGFDGTKRYESEFVAFEPTQIKSATDNSGEYDPGNPNVLRSQPVTGSDFSREELPLKIPGITTNLLNEKRPFAFNGHKADIDDEISGLLAAAAKESEWVADLTMGAGVHTIATMLARGGKRTERQFINEYAPLRVVFWRQMAENPEEVISQAEIYYKDLAAADQEAQDQWDNTPPEKRTESSDQARNKARIAWIEKTMQEAILLPDFNVDEFGIKQASLPASERRPVPIQDTPKAAAWNLVVQNWSGTATVAISVEIDIKPVKLKPIKGKARSVAGTGLLFGSEQRPESASNPLKGSDYQITHSVSSTKAPAAYRTNSKANGISEEAKANLREVAAMVAKATVTQGDAWQKIIPLAEQAKKAGKRLLAFIDPPYWASDANYSEAVASNAGLQSLINYTKTILQQANDLGAKVLFTNDWSPALRDELHKAGFYVYGGTRAVSASNPKPEVVAFNWNRDTGHHEKRTNNFTPSGSANKFIFGRSPRGGNAADSGGSGVSGNDLFTSGRDREDTARPAPATPEVWSSELHTPPGLVGDPAPQPVADTAPATTKGKGVIYAGAPGASEGPSQTVNNYLAGIAYDPKKDGSVKSQPRDAFDRIEELERIAFREVDGSRTIGDPSKAHSMDSDLWRGLDQFRKEQFQKQREDDWMEAAHIMVSNDYQGTIEGILAKGAAGESLTPIQTKAAEIIIAAETAKGIYNPENKDARRQLVALIHAVRTTRTETARTLAAFRDPHRTPAERWKQFVGEALFAPGKKTKRLIEEAPSQAAVDARIRELEERMQRVVSFSAGQQTENASLRREIERLRETATKEQLIDSEIERNKSKIEKRLAEMGITVDDLLTGPVELRLMGAKMIGEHMKTRTPLETQVLALLQGKRAGAESKLSDVATRMRISVEEVKRINDEFLAEMRAELKNRFKKPGFQLQNLELAGTDIDQNAMRSNPGERSDEEAERMAEEALRMMGFYSSEEYDKVRVEKPRSKTKSGKKKDRVNMQVNALDGADIPVWTMEGDGLPLDNMIREAEKQRHSRIRDKAATMPTGEGRTRQGGRLDLGEAPWDGARAYIFDPNNSEHVLQMTRVLEAATRDVTGWDYVNELFISNLLSAPTTQIVNITGYAYGIGRYTVGRAVRAMLNQGKDEGAEQWGEFKPMFEALVDHLPLAFANAAKAWRTELPVTENLRLKTADTFTYLDEPMGVIPGKKGKIVRIPLRVLLAVDEFSKTIFGYTHAATLAYRMGKAKGLKENNLRRFIAAQLRDRSSGIWPEAQREARYVAFQQQLRSWQELKEEGSMHPSFIFEGGLKFLSDIKNADFSDANVMMKLSQFALRLTFPFVRTPYRLLEIGLEMTPLGALAKNVATRTGKRIPNTERQAWMDAKKTAERLGKEARQKGTKEARDAYQTAVKELQAAKDAMDKSAGKGWMRTKQDERKVLEAKSAAITAAMLTMLMIRAAEGDDDDDDKMVLITGTIPNSEDRSGMRQLRNRTHPPQSIGFKIPGSKERLWIDYRRLDPLSTLIATQVDAINQAKRTGKGEGWEKIPTRVMSSIYAQLMDKASLQGFSDLSATLSGDMSTDFMTAIIERGSTIFIPNLVRNLARNTDPLQRDRAYNMENYGAQAKYSALPIAALAPPPAIDLYGRPVKKKGGFMSRAVIPGNPFVQGPPTPTDRTLMAWNQQNPGDPYAPSAPSVKELFTRYQRLNATPQQIQRFTVLRGQIYSRLAAENGFNNLRRPTPQQMDEMQKLGAAASNEARKAIFGE